MLRNETAASPERRAAALRGLAAYQAAERAPRPAAMPVVAQVGRACLRDYGGNGAPVVVVPSLINPPFVLDLSPETSLLRWLAARGHQVLMVDWGSPSPGDGSSVSDHVEQMLPLLASLRERAALIGYCLGGTIALAAACLTSTTGVGLIATPWRFGGYAAEARAAIATLWHDVRASCETLGLVPVEVLQAIFWTLDPARTVAKFEQFATLDPLSEAARAFVALEDWANAGAPLSLHAGRQLFERFYAADEPGTGCWRIGGRSIDPSAIGAPIVDFVSARDRIVPMASSGGFADRRTIDLGHVGMVVGRRARASLWEPLENWLSDLPRPR